MARLSSPTGTAFPHAVVRTIRTHSSVVVARPVWQASAAMSTQVARWRMLVMSLISSRGPSPHYLNNTPHELPLHKPADRGRSPCLVEGSRDEVEFVDVPRAHTAFVQCYTPEFRLLLTTLVDRLGFRVVAGDRAGLVVEGDPISDLEAIDPTSAVGSRCERRHPSCPPVQFPPRP